MNEKNKKKLCVIIITIIILFHAINNFIILKNDNIGLIGHSGANSVYIIRIINFIRNIFEFKPTMFPFYYDPPLFFLSASFFSFIFKFGTNFDMIILVNNIFYLFILITFTYLIGKEIGNRLVGLFSAFLISFFPAIFGYSRFSSPMLASAAILTATMFFLIKSNYFRNGKSTILFGIMTGLGMLTRWSFIFYIIIPIFGYCLIFMTIARNKGYNKKKIAQNILIAFFIFLIISVPWYILSVKNSINQYISSDDYYKECNNKFIFLVYRVSQTNKLNFFKQYLYSLKNFSLRIPIYYLFLISLFISLFMFDKNILFLLIWIFSPFIFFINTFHESSKYLIPVLPAIALLISYTILNIKKFVRTRKKLMLFVKYLITSFIFLTIVFNMYSFFVISYQKPNNRFTSIDSDYRHKTGLLHAERIDWSMDKILSIINTNFPNKKEMNILVIVPRCTTFSSNMYFIERLNHNFKVDFLFECDKEKVHENTYENLIDTADLIFVGNRFSYSGEVQNLPDTNPCYFLEYNLFKYEFEKKITQFKCIDEFDYNQPMNISIIVYKK